ncbi:MULTISPECIES: hypothetical protein [Saccharibacillus]|uniref:hypothetical protein n=1 Tax=Saccharibacillus TaxID=456492 RepID=UPI00123BFA0B|nr:hypothetical protein [Saccharibacillus sp. WB 17]MWJ33512.1 hypothetical protein [Saccharibacillus sp. WB 17]
MTRNRLIRALAVVTAILRKIVKFAIFAVVFLFLAFCSLYIIFPVWNEAHMYTFGQQLRKAPLPEDTVFVEMQSAVGKLNGNGNGIDFFAGMLVRSDLSLSELIDYYDSVSFAGAKDDEHTAEIQVIKANSDELHSKYLERRDLKFRKLRSTEDFSGYYFVNLYDGGYEAVFDLRGN